MFNDDLWAFLGIAGLGIGAYLHGKDSGIKKTIAEYDMKNIIEKQQQQIAELNKKLNDFERNNRFTNNNSGVIV